MIPANTIQEIENLHRGTKTQLIWCGTAAKLQYKESHTCDHTLVDKKKNGTSENPSKEPSPVSQHLVRKAPWADEKCCTWQAGRLPHGHHARHCV